MNYHIGTMLIDEHFNASGECPLCKIRKTVEIRLTEQYLGEGVMEDDTRKEVNELGFCARHYDLLFSFPSKLGLALQVSTRLKTVVKSVEKPEKAKQAKKIADKLDLSAKKCVVCKYLDEHMIRYYKTVAEVYYSKPSFRKRFVEEKGFCLEHFAALNRYSDCAHSEQKSYLNDLYAVENRYLSALEKDLLSFCDHHDYRRRDLPLTEGERDCLKTARSAFYGSKR